MHCTVEAGYSSWQLHFGEPAEREEEEREKNLRDRELETDRKSELGIPQLNCIVFEIPQFLNKWTLSEIINEKLFFSAYVAEIGSFSADRKCFSCR